MLSADSLLLEHTCPSGQVLCLLPGFRKVSGFGRPNPRTTDIKLEDSTTLGQLQGELRKLAKQPEQLLQRVFQGDPAQWLPYCSSIIHESQKRLRSHQQM
jgi:hypothetical protein